MHFNIKWKSHLMKVIAKLDSKLRISCDRRQRHLRACRAILGDMNRRWRTKTYGVLNCHHVTCAPSVSFCHFCVFMTIGHGTPHCTLHLWLIYMYIVLCTMIYKSWMFITAQYYPILHFFQLCIHNLYMIWTSKLLNSDSLKSILTLGLLVII